MDYPLSLYASVCIGNDRLDIRSIEVFWAKNEEEAIRFFEQCNVAATEFVHPQGNPYRHWILMADYKDGESNIFLFNAAEMPK